MRLRRHTHGVVLLRFTDHKHQAPEALCAAGGVRRRSGFVHVEVLNPTHPLDVEPLQALGWSMERRLMSLAGIHGEICSPDGKLLGRSNRRELLHRRGWQSMNTETN